MNHFITETSLLNQSAEGFVEETEMAQLVGFREQVYISTEVYNDCVEWSAQDNKNKHLPHNVEFIRNKRLWSLLQNAQNCLMADLSLLVLNKWSYEFEHSRISRKGISLNKYAVRLLIEYCSDNMGKQIIIIRSPARYIQE